MMKYFEWFCSTFFSTDWQTWNYVLGETRFVNIPLSVTITIHICLLSILVSLIIYWISLRQMRRTWYRIGYTDGIVSKAVKLGKIKFGSAPSGIVIYEIGREEYTNEIETNFERRKKLGTD